MKQKASTKIRKAVAPMFLVIDLFCGAGGTTTGFDMAGGLAKVIACVNHDKLAIRSHAENHPEVLHFEEDIRTLKLQALVDCVAKWRKIYPNAKIILWASLECTNFSNAKGGQSRDADSRTLACGLYKVWNPVTNLYEEGDSYIQLLQPDYIQIENVVEFLSWGPLKIKVAKKHKTHWDLKMVIDKKTGKLGYAWEPLDKKKGEDYMRWRTEICARYDYRDDWKQLDSADFGAFTSRNRLFGIFAKDGLPIEWPEPTHAKKPKVEAGDLFRSPLKPWKAVREVLDFSDEGISIFYRKENKSIPKKQQKNIVDPTFSRIYEGLIKHVAGGKEAFLSKCYGGDPKGKDSSIDDPAGVVTTVDHHSLIRASFLSKYYGGSAESKDASLDGPAGALRTKDSHALVRTSFLTGYNGGNAQWRSPSLNGPIGVLTTRNRFSLHSVAFLSKYNSNSPKTGTNAGHSLDEPCPVIATQDRLAPVFLQTYNGNAHSYSVCKWPSPTILSKDSFSLIWPQYFIDKQYGTESTIGVNQPAGTIVKNDKHSLVQAVPFIVQRNSGNDASRSVSLEGPARTLTATAGNQDLVRPVPFISRQFSAGERNTSVEQPAGSITQVPKMDLVQPMILSQNYTNVPTSLDEPCPVITANRKWHYLLNPSWYGHSTSIDDPCPVLIARQDKAPLYLLAMEMGSVVIPVYEDDSEILIKIKEFMVLYGIKDIKMRMLRVPELLKIQGFPDGYKLAGKQEHQKKFIGNSVVPIVVRDWCQALSRRLVKLPVPEKHKRSTTTKTRRAA